MRTISALKIQKRNPNRVNIYLDGEFGLGVTRIIAARLHVGQSLDEEKIKMLQEQEVREVAYERALQILSRRPHSEGEIRWKLARKDFSDEEISDVIQRLRTAGLVADEQFARDWVENRSAFRPRSRRMLALELRQKGIDDETVQAVLEDAVDDDDLAYQAASRYARRLDKLEWDKFRERLGGFLLRRGFSYGTAQPVIKKVWQEMKSGVHADQTTENEE